MSYTQVNPYCTLDQLKDELKMDRAEAEQDDELSEAIFNASRWLDDYSGRDFFYHDHTVTALEIDQNSDKVFEDQIFLDWPVLSLTEILLGADALTQNTHFVIAGSAPHHNRRLVYIQGDTEFSWSRMAGAGCAWTIYRPGRVLSLKGTFGYLQSFYTSVTEAGDASDQLSNWDLSGLSSAVLYWQLADVAGAARVRLFSDEALANLVAEGTGAHASAITLAEANASGISGTVDCAYTIDDLDSGNTLTPGVAAIDRSQVPIGIPGKINLCCRLVAAAFSGHNRKQVAGLDGTQTSIQDRAIPKSVFDMLGKRYVIL